MHLNLVNTTAMAPLNYTQVATTQDTFTATPLTSVNTKITPPLPYILIILNVCCYLQKFHKLREVRYVPQYFGQLVAVLGDRPLRQQDLKGICEYLFVCKLVCLFVYLFICLPQDNFTMSLR